MIRVGVVGAAGRMGREVCRSVAADPELELVAAVDRSPGEPIEGEPRTLSLDEFADDDGRLVERAMQVAIDFTHPDVVLGNVRWFLDHGVHSVVGTTGITPEGLDEIRAIAEAGPANVVVAPNFAIGAVLMMRFAAEASRFLPDAEIVELHHAAKADAPSGTAMATARRMAASRGAARAARGEERVPGARGADVEGVHIHSVRLPGLVAHQAVILGGQGQTLTIRHDSVDRTSFMPGVLMAVKAVASLPGLTVGLDALLEEA